MQEMRKTGRGRSQRGREREIIFTLTGAKFQGRLPREAEAGPGLPIKGPKGWVTGRNTMKWGGGGGSVRTKEATKRRPEASHSTSLPQQRAASSRTGDTGTCWGLRTGEKAAGGWTRGDSCSDAGLGWGGQLPGAKPKPGPRQALCLRCPGHPTWRDPLGRAHGRRSEQGREGNTSATHTLPLAHAHASPEAQAQAACSFHSPRGPAGRGLTQAVPAARLQDPPGALLSVFREAGAVQQVRVGAQGYHLAGQGCRLGSWGAHAGPWAGDGGPAGRSTQAWARGSLGVGGGTLSSVQQTGT